MRDDAAPGVLKRHRSGNEVEFEGLKRLVQMRAANVEGDCSWPFEQASYAGSSLPQTSGPVFPS